jgi:drug/metabolite transporter (DMT)-like permease
VKVVAYLFAAVLGLLGVVFVAGHQGVALRIVVGVVLLAAAVALVVAVRIRPRVEQRNIVQRIDLSGDVRPEELTCNRCGAQLSSQSVVVRAGAVFVACEYCQASYQLEEEPKW